MQDMYFK